MTWLFSSHQPNQKPQVLQLDISVIVLSHKAKILKLQTILYKKINFQVKTKHILMLSVNQQDKSKQNQ